MKNTNTTKLSSKEACTLAHQIRHETGCSLAEAFKAAYSRNTTPAAPKTSWTSDELTKIFSDKTAELLNKGYILDVAHMSGHQGEICKVLFTKNDEYFQLIMVTDNEYHSWYGEKIVIRFGKYTEEVRPSRSINDWNTLWVNKFDTQWSMTFVKVTDNYYVTPELAEEFSAKKHQRVMAKVGTKPQNVSMSDRCNKAALACVRKQKGFKGVKASEIVSVKRCNHYDIRDEYTGFSYKIELSRLNKYGKNTVIDVHF